MFSRVFIPGKNWKLSLAEIGKFLEARKIRYEIHSFSREFFLIALEDPGEKFITDLGGFIKIGNPRITLSSEIIKNAFLHQDTEAQRKFAANIVSSGLVSDMFRTGQNRIFGISIYCVDPSLKNLSGKIQRFIGSTIKREFAKSDKKVTFMGFSRNRKKAQLSHIEVLKKRLIENNAEIMFCIDKDSAVLSTTTAVHDPFEFQKRDIEKPKQRKIFAMPPRLARIMVNLSSCAEGKILLDPFCGVGAILQEALLAKAIVVGTDINSWCVEAAYENLEWMKREYGIEKADVRVIQADARRLVEKIGSEEIDCIVTEPDLGPALRHVPTQQYAIKIIERLEPLYSSFMKEAYKIAKNEGRLVIVTPYIKTRSKKIVTMPIREIGARVGFEIVEPFQTENFRGRQTSIETLAKRASLIDVKETHKIGREISIFKK